MTKAIIAALLLITTTYITLAQKLPQIQQAGLRAPDNVKIDGNAAEWKKLQAYNIATGIFYTMANDDDKLYLTIKASDQLVIRKIIAGGISLVINSDPEFDHNKPISITYPLFGKNNTPPINVKDRPIISPLIVKDPTVNIYKIDSFIYASNQQIASRTKDIKTKGAIGIQDTLISVYNTYGIQAVGIFDPQMNYVYELALPFKYLNLSFDKQPQFHYKIVLNGTNYAEGTTIEDIKGGIRTKYEGTTPVPIDDLKFIHYPIDLTGSYTLMKSQ